MPENEVPVDPNLVPPSPSLLAEMEKASLVGGEVKVADSLQELVPPDQIPPKVPDKPTIDELPPGINKEVSRSGFSE